MSDQDEMSAVEKLLAIEEIKKLKARYFRYLDEGTVTATPNLQKWREIFTEDAIGTYPDDGDMRFEGVDQIVALSEGFMKGGHSIHHGHMPEIEITSPTTAEGIWAMFDYLRFDEGHPQGWQQLVGYGHYREKYVKTAAGWRIQRLHLTRLHSKLDIKTD